MLAVRNNIEYMTSFFNLYYWLFSSVNRCKKKSLDCSLILLSTLKLCQCKGVQRFLIIRLIKKRLAQRPVGLKCHSPTAEIAGRQGPITNQPVGQINISTEDGDKHKKIANFFISFAASLFSQGYNGFVQSFCQRFVKKIAPK